jgi:hypothetical protein
MALKIKKQIKNPDGTMTEIEGTEAEVEAFLRKAQKQNETAEKAERKKNLILGKEAKAEIQKMIEDAVRIAIGAHEILKQHGSSVVHEHHYYRHGGYYWQPWYDGSYRYRPFNSDIWVTCNSLAEVGTSIGTDVSSLVGSMADSTQTLTVAPMIGTNGVYTANNTPGLLLDQVSSVSMGGGLAPSTSWLKG